ncbi:DUF4018 domain-containing protein [Peribacillus kribbensis]|uniref:DUF4018 domain-containing protein n=1 Tax=Peribacillus kribbensis TaxID=356658 RepID=UPI000406616C|nr:DUF4018 domain-containing protein [Peribacillus kribbensis]
MFSLLADLAVQFISFFVLFNTDNVLWFAGIITGYYLISIFLLKKVPNLVFYCLLFLGTSYFRMRIPTLPEFLLLGLVIIVHILYTSKTRRIGMHRVMGVLGVGAAGLAGVYCLPFILGILKGILHLAALGIGYMIARPLAYLFSLIHLSDPKGAEERIKKVFGRKPPEVTDYTGSDGNQIFYYIIGILFAALILFIVYKIGKKRSMLKGLSLNMGDVKIQEFAGTGFVKTQRPPQDPIRKCVFTWEKKLKGTKSRNSGESFAQWISRICEGSEEKIDQEFLIAAYSTVRYHEKMADQAMIKEFRQEMKKLAHLKQA